MKCVLFNQSVKVLSRAIHSLARIGDEMVVEPFKHGLKLSTVDKSESAYTQFWFPVQSFFYSYKYEDNENPDDLRLKISFKALLTVFKTCHSADKIVASCTIQIENNIPAMIIKMQFNAGYSKTHSLFISDCVPINANYSSTGRNEIVLPPKVLSSALRNFHTHQSEITLAVDSRKTIINNYDDKTLESDQNIRSQLSLDPGEFTSYRIGLDTALNFTVKETKAMLAFAENVTGVLKITFDEPTKPIVFNISEAGMFEANYILATESSDTMSNIGSSPSDVSSSLAATRGRGIRRVPSAEEDTSGAEPKRACTNKNRVGTNNNDGNGFNSHHQEIGSLNVQRDENGSLSAERRNNGIGLIDQHQNVGSSLTNQRPNDASMIGQRQSNSSFSSQHRNNSSSFSIHRQSKPCGAYPNEAEKGRKNIGEGFSDHQTNGVGENNEDNVFSRVPRVNSDMIGASSGFDLNEIQERRVFEDDNMADMNADNVDQEPQDISHIHRVENDVNIDGQTKNHTGFNSNRNPSSKNPTDSNSNKNPSSIRVNERHAVSNPSDKSDHFDERFASIENILFGNSNLNRTNVSKTNPKQVIEPTGEVNSSHESLHEGHSSRYDRRQGSISYGPESNQESLRSRPNQNTSRTHKRASNHSARSEVYSDFTSNNSANKNSQHEEFISRNHSINDAGEMNSQVQSMSKVNALRHYINSSDSSHGRSSENHIESFDCANFQPVEDFEMEPPSQDTTVMNVCTPLNAEKLKIVFRHCLEGEGNIGKEREERGGKVLVCNSDDDES